MKKKTRKPNKPLYIIFSVLIATALWFYVRSVDDSDYTRTISNIPVTFVGEDILHGNGLMVAMGTQETVDLTVQGRQSVVSQLRRDNVTVQVDLSRIPAEGEHQRAYDIIWPSSVSTSSFDLVDRDPFYVPVTVVKRSTRQVEVKGVINGDVADGFQAGEVVFQPAAIEVSGSGADVAQVAYAQVTLNLDGQRETIRADMPYVLVGQDGEVIESDTIQTSPELVNVTLPVAMTKEVPLTVEFLAGGGVSGATDAHLNYSITPKSVVLSGSEADLAAYNAIDLGVVDLSKVIRTETFTLPILIGPEVENLSGVQEATVNVSIRGLEVRDFVTENIELIAPEDVDAVVVTKSLSVQVRGTKAALDQVLPQAIKVQVDLTDLSSVPEGQSQVPAKVTLRGTTDAGVVGEYKVSVAIGAAARQLLEEGQ